MVVGDVNDEVIFCVHESCDEKKCGRRKEGTILNHLRKLFGKILSLAKKLDDQTQKVRLPENISRSQFYEILSRYKGKKEITKRDSIQKCDIRVDLLK